MAQNKHKYRVSMYIGKVNFEKLEKTAELMKIPVASLAKVIFETGLEVSKIIADNREKTRKEAEQNGNE